MGMAIELDYTSDEVAIFDELPALIKHDKLDGIEL